MSERDEKMRLRYEDLPNMTREDWCNKHELPFSSWYVYMEKAGLRKQTRKQVRGIRTTEKTTQWNITVENDVHQWVIENIPRGKRSAFVNDLVKAHITKSKIHE